MVVLGNKSDLQTQRQVKTEKALAFCSQFENTWYAEVSALDGSSVENAFFTACEMSMVKKPSAKQLKKISFQGQTDFHSIGSKCCKAATETTEGCLQAQHETSWTLRFALFLSRHYND